MRQVPCALWSDVVEEASHLEEASMCFPEGMEERGLGGLRASCIWSVNESDLQSVLGSSSFKSVPVIFIDTFTFLFPDENLLIFMVLLI